MTEKKRMKENGDKETSRIVPRVLFWKKSANGDVINSTRGGKRLNNLKGKNNAFQMSILSSRCPWYI